MYNDLLKIIAFVKVYHSDVFGVKYFNIDHGKDNLESYFIAKLGWSRYRIDKAIKLLKECGAIIKRTADVPNLYSLSILHKTFLKNID